jgi:hypothetical protein
LICFIFLFRFWHYRKKGKGLTLKLFRIFILLTKAGNMNMLLPARMALPTTDYARKVGDKQEEKNLKEER